MFIAYSFHWCTSGLYRIGPKVIQKCSSLTTVIPIKKAWPKLEKASDVIAHPLQETIGTPSMTNDLISAST